MTWPMSHRKSAAEEGFESSSLQPQADAWSTGPSFISFFGCEDLAGKVL